MKKIIFAVLAVFAVTLAGCTAPEPQLGPDGKPLPRVYRISPGDTSKIQYRMLDGVNALRQARGLTPLVLNAQLNAAAATHSRDVAVQNRPWDFGSDGSSLLDRAERVGYPHVPMGENVMETYLTEMETLAGWMEHPNTAEVILQKESRDMGFAWYQEPNGKIWWTLVTGDGGYLAETPGSY